MAGKTAVVGATAPSEEAVAGVAAVTASVVAEAVGEEATASVAVVVLAEVADLVAVALAVFVEADSADFVGECAGKNAR